MRKLLPLLIASIFLLHVSAFAQRIENVTVVDDFGQNLAQEAELKLSGFRDALEQYLSYSEFSPDEWDTPVELNLQFSLTYQPSGAEDRYTGELVIGNNYDIIYPDTRLRFKYNQGDMLTFDEFQVESLTSLLNFYVFMILGGEYDKWGTLAGQQYFEKARNVAEQAKIGLNEFQLGWDRRLDHINYILSERHRPFREMVDYYFYGVSFINEDNAKARKHVAMAIEMLDEHMRRNTDDQYSYASNFIKAHYQEIGEIFRRAQDKSPIRTMMVVDDDDGHDDYYNDILRN